MIILIDKIKEKQIILDNLQKKINVTDNYVDIDFLFDKQDDVRKEMMLIIKQLILLLDK
jgi:hypothetical protein